MAVDDSDKGELVEELNKAPLSWDKGQRGRGREASTIQSIGTL